MLIGNFILSPVTIQSSTYNAACSWIRIESLPLSLSPNNPASASRNWTALDRRMRWLQIQFQCKYTRQCRGNGNWIKYSDTETDRIRIQIALSKSLSLSLRIETIPTDLSQPPMTDTLVVNFTYPKLQPVNRVTWTLAGCCCCCVTARLKEMQTDRQRRGPSGRRRNKKTWIGPDNWRAIHKEPKSKRTEAFQFHNLVLGPLHKIKYHDTSKIILTSTTR